MVLAAEWNIDRKKVVTQVSVKNRYWPYALGHFLFSGHAVSFEFVRKYLSLHTVGGEWPRVGSTRFGGRAGLKLMRINELCELRPQVHLQLCSAHLRRETLQKAQNMTV